MPWGVAAAAIGGAVVSGVAANSAAKKQAGAADRASELSDAQYKQTREDQLAAAAQARADNAPYREAGYGALSQLVGGTQPGGQFVKPFSMEDYQQDPGYQFRLAEGEQGINRAANASGSRYSGATLKALARFNSNQASQEYGNAFNRYTSQQGNAYNRLAGLSGTGQTAVAGTNAANNSAMNSITSAGLANANAQGQAAQNAAAATASGYVGTANSINGAIGTISNAYQQQQYLNSLKGTPTGGTPTTGASGYYDMPIYANNAGVA